MVGRRGWGWVLCCQYHLENSPGKALDRCRMGSGVLEGEEERGGNASGYKGQRGVQMTSGVVASIVNIVLGYYTIKTRRRDEVRG